LTACAWYRLFWIAISFFILVEPSSALSREANALNSIPEDNIKTLPLASEQSVSTFLPSGSAPGRGLAINIVYPQKPRYKDGAPIVIVVPGGDTADGLNFCLHAAQIGCLEIRMAFPGGGSGAFRSSGVNDYRGVKSQKALRDVLLFAAGKLQDFRNRTITDLIPIPLAQNNLGIVGWSNGGNIALITMEKYARQLGFIDWLVLYECPIGSLFFPPSLGSTDYFLLNNHYRQGSAATGHCLLDYRKLAWEADIKQNPGVYKKLGEADLPGVVYFDDNQNGKWDESTEFAFNYCVDHASTKTFKKFYPPDVTAAMERLKIFEKDAPQPAVVPPAPAATAKGKRKNRGASTPVSAAKSPIAAVEDKPAIYWPSIIATLNEAENYFQERDGSTSIPAISSLYPHLLVTIFASQADHLQTQPDHPHIILQYNAFIDSGAHWVRLNPESIYPAEMANMSRQNFAQNEPNSPINAEGITEYLEPEDILSDYVFVNAALAELADRKRANNLKSPLIEAIYQYSNGLPASPSNQTKPPQPNSDNKAK